MSMLRAVIIVGLAAGPLSAQEAPSLAQRILAAAGIPGAALEARAAGVPERDVVGVLDILRSRKVPSTDAKDILGEQVRTSRSDQPMDNFGAFVQARLDEGLRGRELAAAIRREHEAQGKGRGAAQGKTRGNEDRKSPDRTREKVDVRVEDTAHKDHRPDTAEAEGGRKDRRPVR